MSLLHSLIPLFAAEGVPPDSPVAQLAAPLGALLFLGSIYLLLRSNLGTRRGYFVFGASLFGFLFVMSLFWTFGAPGTPRASGPTNLPGQVPNEYLPTWVAFAETSRIAELPPYRFVTEDPGRFGPVPEGFANEAEAGTTDVQNFFSSEAGGQLLGATWAPVETQYAEADNGLPVLRITYQEVDEALDVVPDGETVTLYGFFDEGAPLFPGLVFAAASFLLFLLHAFLLDRDEQRERRDRAELAQPEQERVPASA